jgi:hypothetical protein
MMFETSPAAAQASTSSVVGRSREHTDRCRSVAGQPEQLNPQAVHPAWQAASNPIEAVTIDVNALESSEIEAPTSTSESFILRIAET